MSIVNKIENISNHLKNAYDELQGLGADLTNVNKNIENISMVLNNIYDSMPQVSGEGTSLTLDNTRVGKIKSVLKGNTSQTETPTPTSPISINVVSGDNTITISNQDGTNSNIYNIDLPVENLFDKDNANYVNGWIDGTTMRLNTINGNRMFYIPCKPNTTYTISRSIITSSFRTTTYDSTPFPTVTGSNVNYTVPTVIQNNSGTTLTITTGINAKYLVVHYGKIEDTNLNETLATIQVEYGSKQNRFTPYGTTPIELNKIGNYQDSIKKSTGKNLFDKSTALIGYQIDANGNLTPNSHNFVSGFIKVKKNTDYYVNSYCSVVIGYSSSFAFLSEIKNNAQSGTFNTGNAEYIRVKNWYANDSDTLNNQLNGAMLNLGTTPLPYEPYGTGWYVEKNIGKVVLNGTENWYSNGQKCQMTFDLNQYVGEADQCFSNYFKSVSYDSTSELGICMQQVDNKSYLQIPTGITYFGSVANFKNWLAIHNTLVYYSLATPINVEITYEPLIDQFNLLEKAQSKNNQTNISQVNNDLPFIISANALMKNSD